MLKDKLYNIKEEILEAKKLKYLDFVGFRLNKTTLLYIDELERSYNNLILKENVFNISRELGEE